MSPDDLEIGKSYKFRYVSHTGKQFIQTGELTRIEKWQGILWYFFKDIDGEFPFDYYSLSRPNTEIVLME